MQNDTISTFSEGANLSFVYQAQENRVHSNNKPGIAGREMCQQMSADIRNMDCELYFILESYNPTLFILPWPEETYAILSTYCAT